jgi:hypothetical protein
MHRRQCRSTRLWRATCSTQHVARHDGPERHGRPCMSHSTVDRSDMDDWACRTPLSTAATWTTGHVALHCRPKRHGRLGMSPGTAWWSDILDRMVVTTHFRSARWTGSMGSGCRGPVGRAPGRRRSRASVAHARPRARLAHGKSICPAGGRRATVRVPRDGERAERRAVLPPTTPPSGGVHRGRGRGTVLAEKLARSTDARPAAERLLRAPVPADASRIPVSHRPSTTCPAHPAGTSTAPACMAMPADSGLYGQCATDSDCTSGINGRCICQYPPDDAGAPYLRCAYDRCGSDNDCSGQVCGCGVDIGSPSATHALFGQYACIPGQCHADSDCGDGGYCSPSLSPCGFVADFACHTAQDECVNDTDCTAEVSLDGGVAACVYKDGRGYWTCSQVNACPDGGAH